MKKIAVIDNYDSFTYNLAHYLEDLDCEVTVYRNDDFDIAALSNYEKIVLSPGPGIPDEAGLLKEVIRTYATTKSILGICLGQQAIAEVFGGTILNLQKVYHGVSCKLTVTADDEMMFFGLEKQINVGRYHSWTVSSEDLPGILEITSVDEWGNIMSLRHKTFDIRGMQFHPESVLTPDGKKMLQNWLTN